MLNAEAKAAVEPRPKIEKKSKASMSRPLTEPTTAMAPDLPVPPKAMPIVSPFKSRAPVPKIPKGSAGCGITRSSVTGAICVVSNATGSSSSGAGSSADGGKAGPPWGKAFSLSYPWRAPKPNPNAPY